MSEQTTIPDLDAAPPLDVLTADETVPDTLVEPPPTSDVLTEVRHYYALLQHDYARRVLEIEKFLGFAEGCEALGTRLAKVEAFLGIKG